MVGAIGVTVIDVTVALVTSRPSCLSYSVVRRRNSDRIAGIGDSFRLLDQSVWPTVAIAGFDDVQFARLVTLSVLPLVKVPVAVYCRLVPCAKVVVAGVIAIDTRSEESTVAVVLPTTSSLSSREIVTGVAGRVQHPSPVR